MSTMISSAVSRPDALATPAAPQGVASSFLRDCWYAAAWSQEVGDQLFGRTICDEKIVLLRKADNTVAAVSGVCPHRFASLDKGRRLAGDRLQCPYHGLEFDTQGNCVGNPHGPLPRIGLTPFAVVERHSVIWLWFGDPERADPALIPDFSMFDDPRYRTIRGQMTTRAHYELITDNLLDLSHVGFVHQGGLGSDAIKNGQHEVVVAGTTVHSNRWCPDGAPSPVWSMMFGGYQDNVDHWLDMRWDAPSTMLLDVGVAPAGQDRSTGIAMPGAHILTPETETSTHYFWAATRSFALDDDALDVQLRTAIEHAFINEDKPILEDVQANLKGARFEQMRPPTLSFDIGAMRARRILTELRSGRVRQEPSQAMPVAD